MARKKKLEVILGPLDLDGVLGKPKNRVLKVGIELEGGWNKKPEGIQKIDRDGSVFKDAGDDNRDNTRTKLPGMEFGEIPIGPIQPAQIKAALRKYYPDKIDESCGMHVHMSFATLHQYSLLMDSPSYQDTVVEYLSRWAIEEGFPKDHHIWPRLQDKNVYCQRKFWPEHQIVVNRKDHDHEKEGHRYTMIHYCWARNNTVECRLLPMMDTKEQALRAIKRVLDVTNAYLLVVDKGKIKAEGKVELDNGDSYEEYVQVMA